MIKRDDIPVGSTYSDVSDDENGNKMTHKDSRGCWCERTFDDAGNQLTYKDSIGFWCESTYDENGNELTYKNSEGYCSERTFDDAGIQQTFKESIINNGEEFYRIAQDSEYALFTNANKEVFVAGCRKFTRKQALVHWGSRSDNRAVLFAKAIRELI